MSKIDDTDRRILRILQEDSRTAVSKIAEQVGLSASTCWRRINALETTGAIRKYSIDLDPVALDLNFQAIVHVQLTRHDKDGIEAFFRAIKTTPQVRECYAVTGQSDYQLFVQCRDVTAYNRFLDDFLFATPAVASAQTNMVLKVIKAPRTPA